MTQPLFRRLKKLHPGCTIDVFAPKWSMAVFERMPEVNEILENPFGHGALELKRRWRVGRELGRRGYDRVIVLPGSLKSAVIALATGIGKRTGYVGESRYFLLNDIRRLDKERLPLMVDRYTALAHQSQEDFDGHSGFPEFSIDERRREISIETFGLNLGKPVLAFCPGAEFGRQSVGRQGILPSWANTIRRRVGRFGCSVRKKMMKSPKKSTAFQTACVSICAAKPICRRQWICCRWRTRSCATTAG